MLGMNLAFARKGQNAQYFNRRVNLPQARGTQKFRRPDAGLRLVLGGGVEEDDRQRFASVPREWTILREIDP